MKYGYYDKPGDEPAYDPGLEVECPICWKKLSRPIKSISLMLMDDDRSYFYRVHKLCYERLSEEEVTKLDSVLVDAVANKRSAN
jgi:hypothetical protein